VLKVERRAVRRWRSWAFRLALCLAVGAPVGALRAAPGGAGAGTAAVSEATSNPYGARVTAELQRLRRHIDADVFVIFDAGAGYVQCAPEASPAAIYCEAQSAQSDPALATLLTPDRLARLHQAGYADPGPAPNYSKTYALTEPDAAIARELLAILHDVYGYDGAGRIKVTTEAGSGG